MHKMKCNVEDIPAGFFLNFVFIFWLQIWLTVRGCTKLSLLLHKEHFALLRACFKLIKDFVAPSVYDAL